MSESQGNENPVRDMGNGSNRGRVLLVEDNSDILEALHFILEELGVEVTVAQDGGRGVQLALEQRPDLCLIDIGLPLVNGYEAARLIRADPAGAGLFLVALTGYSMADDRRQALEAGFDAHVVKPLKFEDLSTLIDEARARMTAAPGGR